MEEGEENNEKVGEEKEKNNEDEKDGEEKMGEDEPKEYERKLEAKVEGAMKEENEGNNEEGTRRMRKIRNGKRRRILSCGPKLLRLLWL